MQENDGKCDRFARFSPRCKSVRRIYFGRIVAFVSAVCFAVAAGILVFSYRAQAKSNRKEYLSELVLFVGNLSEQIDDVIGETERAEISSPLAVLKIEKLSAKVERESETKKELADIREAFSLFFGQVETDGIKISLARLSASVDKSFSDISALN